MMLTGKILVVDDEKRMCAVIKAGLETKGMEINMAYDGESALFQFAQLKHDIVITDLKMPGMDGLTILQKVKDISPQTEVLLITAYATAQTAVEAMKQGAYDYIIKPFEIAGEGTIFLDEIGDISPVTQIKLLRVLQNREFNRLGGNETFKTNSRTLAATNRKLEQALKENTFREDLYYRINVFPIFLPPLRERKEDIPDLVGHFLKKLNIAENNIDSKAVKLLMDYPWPGNVRELENVIERVFIMSGGERIKTSDLPPHIRGEEEMPVPMAVAEQSMTLAEMEKHMIQRALSKAEGNKSLAAKLLGITRRKLYSMMERLE